MLVDWYWQEFCILGSFHILMHSVGISGLIIQEVIYDIISLNKEADFMWTRYQWSFVTMSV